MQPEPEVIEAKYEDEHSVLALAEIMLSFGRLRGAADTLAEHIEQTMPDSIEPWSMLLDLYRRGGMREFEALAGKMRGRFNAATPSWSESTTPISGLKSTEDFPHVIQRTSTLAEVSFAEEADPYTHESSLIGTWRGKQRYGTVTFFPDGRIFAEYQVLLPHPTRKTAMSKRSRFGAGRRSCAATSLPNMRSKR